MNGLRLGGCPQRLGILQDGTQVALAHHKILLLSDLNRLRAVERKARQLRPRYCRLGRSGIATQVIETIYLHGGEFVGLRERHRSVVAGVVEFVIYLGGQQRRDRRFYLAFVFEPLAAVEGLKGFAAQFFAFRQVGVVACGEQFFHVGGGQREVFGRVGVIARCDLRGTESTDVQRFEFPKLLDVKIQRQCALAEHHLPERVYDDERLLRLIEFAQGHVQVVVVGQLHFPVAAGPDFVAQYLHQILGCAARRQSRIAPGDIEPNGDGNKWENRERDFARHVPGARTSQTAFEMQAEQDARVVPDGERGFEADDETERLKNEQRVECQHAVEVETKRPASVQFGFGTKLHGVGGDGKISLHAEAWVVATEQLKPNPVHVAECAGQGRHGGVIFKIGVKTAHTDAESAVFAPSHHESHAAGERDAHH